jgi:hypothetical protein
MAYEFIADMILPSIGYRKLVLEEFKEEIK